MSLDLIILGIVGAVLSLVFKYYAPAAVWYAAQANKGLVMLGAVVLVTAAYFGASCLPQLGLHLAVSCDQPGALQSLQALFVIAAGNQLAYLFSNPSAK